LRLLSALAALLLLTASAHAAAGDKPLIAVVPFTGPQAQSAEAVVVRTLRRKATLVQPAAWQKSAKKLFAKTHSPDDISSVAEDVGAEIVITGVVKRDGRAWQLTVSVREGKSGRSHDKLKYPLKGPRISAETLKLLADEVDAAFEHTLAAIVGGGQDEPQPAAKKPIKKAPAQATEEPTPAEEPPPSANANANTNAKENANANENANGNEEAPKQPPPVENPARRPRWAYYVDATVGGSISGRSFDFDPSSQPRFKSGVTGGLRVDLTIYPFAFSWRKAAGVLAGLGFGLTFAEPFWLPSTAKDDPTQKFATTERQVEGGLRWRFVLYKKVPRPELTLLAGGGMHTFSIVKDSTGMDVGPPDVAYKYLAIGGGLKLHFAEWASLWAQFTYHVVFDAGSVQTDSEYGPGSKYGIRVAGGLDFFVWRGLKVGALGSYERYVLGFSGTGVVPPMKVASSAIDQYFGGVIVIGYVY
jgi:hypothetical protein